MKTSLYIPPLTQINTPYPSTSYIKGFLKTTPFNDVSQADLGLELILGIFNSFFLKKIFNNCESNTNLSNNAVQILQQKESYIKCVDTVIQFLQHKNPTLAHKICSFNYLPQASRFNILNDDISWMFGTLGIQDKAKMLCTLFMEDINDLIVECISPDFGFSRYAEDIARTATSFDPILQKLEAPNNIIDELLNRITHQHIINENPDLVALTIPFPGNVYGAFKIGQYIKRNFPHIKVVMGGGYPNTELRSLSDPRVFDYTDFITLDDGEKPILNILELVNNQRDIKNLKRTFIRSNNQVEYINNCTEPDINHAQSATPDYTGLPLDKYISMLEVANPMHRLWSDGRWNKLTVAHGCYWKKCSFCDISLDYIGRYEPAKAIDFVDKIENIILQTGTNGFHFVDEAAPPLALRDIALEILNRKLDISWWTNIRFEKTFTADLCKLLAASGCIAVTGGLEVASDRLLQLMEKGVSIKQVSDVTRNFTEAGVMVHAYLMYGFPTQTTQETIDSLEVVRQMFEAGILQSGFWHRFSMTTHSPVGLNPDKYKVKNIGPGHGTFANNDLFHDDPTGANHDLFAEGLRKSLYNYMLDNCLDWPTSKWFDFKTPKTTLKPNLIQGYLNETSNLNDLDKLNYKILFLGSIPTISENGKNAKFEINTPTGILNIKSDKLTAEFFKNNISKVRNPSSLLTLDDFLLEYQKLTSFPKDVLLHTDIWHTFRTNGLILIRI